MESVQGSWLRGSCIGQGSFGTVNLAVDKSDGRVFAVKSVEKTSASSQLIALENEIKILKSLSSPYVVNYLGDDVSKENFAMFRNLHVEYMPGGTAADLAEFPGADVDEGIVSAVTRRVVSALKYVHSLGIVHCDVKGRNVLVGSSKGVAKLADFGSAVELKDWKLPRGSPLWMAPEVIRGEYQGPESDVWSLGCTVIEMVTGKPAWQDRGFDTVFQIGYSDELPKIPAQLSQLGKDFLDKCLRRNCKDRWSCDQLLQHPFLLSSCSSDVDVEVSPRCTLDWLNSNFSDKDDDQDHRLFNFKSNKSKLDSTQKFDSKTSDCFLKNRISSLASKSGAIWEESDGWESVRTLTNEKQQEQGSNSCCGAGKKEKERVIMVVEDSITEETTEKYSVSTVGGEISGGINWEYIDSKDNDNVLPNEIYPKYFSDKFTARAEVVLICPHVFRHENYSYCTSIYNKAMI
ncbi:Clathrin, heavy chain [Heracleum sosnowskyi]|uniref:Clathrin, heavy chain n=1 Tax=Heracleum sosnowskyi TaxID=360622 RepID=A0AAD8HV37_9APIA|nr:Clathrin, heavy chain [Heracleum sosnowskyi]